MRLWDPHQYTVTGFANDFPLSSAPPPYSEYPTDQQRAPTRAHYLSMGIEPPPPRYATINDNNDGGNGNYVCENGSRRRRRCRHRRRRPAPRYPPQPFPLPCDGCADTVLQTMMWQAEDELDWLEQEADDRVAEFCARKRLGVTEEETAVAAGRPGPQEQEQEQQLAGRPVGGVLLGRVEFERGVAEAMEAFREGKKRICKC